MLVHELSGTFSVPELAADESASSKLDLHVDKAYMTLLTDEVVKGFKDDPEVCQHGNWEKDIPMDLVAKQCAIQQGVDSSGRKIPIGGMSIFEIARYTSSTFYFGDHSETYPWYVNKESDRATQVGETPFTKTP